jgi:hypothetical protein
MNKKPEQIIQDKVNPSQSRGGLGGLLDYARTQNENTGLSRAQTFAAALDPFIMPEMRAGESIRERGMQRVAAGNKNKTIEYLKANGFEDIANALATGSIDAGSAVNFAFQRTSQEKQFGRQKELIDYENQLKGPPKPSAAEKRIERLITENGLSREVATGLVDGSIKLQQNPVTGLTELVNVKDFLKDKTETVETLLPEVSTGEKFADLKDIKSAFGIEGAGRNILNTITDAVGLGQPLGGEDVGKATAALTNLATTTTLNLAAEFPGRPSNFTRERIEELTIKPGELSTGPARALQKATEMRKLMQSTYDAAINTANNETLRVEDRNAARSALNNLEVALNDYISLEKALSPASSIEVNQSDVDLMNELLRL